MNALRSAFTLLEMMITILILALVIAAAGAALDQGERMSERIAIENELTDKVNRILNDMAMELRTADADPAKLLVGLNGSTLTSPTYSEYGDPSLKLGYSDYTKLVIYQYCVSSGIADIPATAGNPLATPPIPPTPETFGGKLETTFHRIVYDPTPSGGTLSKELWDPTTTPESRVWRVTLCDQVITIDPTAPDPNYPRGGFFIDQIGNTLAMQLAVFTKYRVGYSGETIVKIANSQVLFLRSTLDTNLGSAAYNQSDSRFTGDNAALQTPSIFFGHLITYAKSTSATDPNGEISIFMQPPIGQRLDPASALITVTTTNTATGLPNPPKTMAEGVPVDDAGFYTHLTRSTRPDKNGNITITLTTTTVASVLGTIPGSFMVEAKVSTLGSPGLSATVDKNF